MQLSEDLSKRDREIARLQAELAAMREQVSSARPTHTSLVASTLGQEAPVKVLTPLLLDDHGPRPSRVQSLRTFWNTAADSNVATPRAESRLSTTEVQSRLQQLSARGGAGDLDEVRRLRREGNI